MARRDAATGGASDLFHDLAHDLRAPLAAIQGYAELLIRQGAGPLNARQLEFLDGIRQQQDRLHGQLEAFIALAQYLGGFRVPQPGPLDLATELAGYADRAGLGPRAASNLSGDSAPPSAVVLADPELLRQVLDLLAPVLARQAGAPADLRLEVRQDGGRGWACFVADAVAAPASPGDHAVLVARRLLGLQGAVLDLGMPQDVAPRRGTVLCACGFPLAGRGRARRPAG